MRLLTLRSPENLVFVRSDSRSCFCPPGSLQRDFSSADPLPSEAGVGAKGPGCKIRAVPIRGVGGATPEWAGEKGVLTKSVSCDGAQLKLLSRLDRGCRKLRGIQVSGRLALEAAASCFLCDLCDLCDLVVGFTSKKVLSIICHQ